MNPKFTLSPLPASVLSAALALTIAAWCAAAPAAPAQTATADTAIYVINNHKGLVTVTEGSGETVLTRHIATPTVLAIFTQGPLGAGTPVAAKPVLAPRYLTLEDANGLRLWSTPLAVTEPVKYNVHFYDGAKGMVLSIDHTLNGVTNPNKPEVSPVVYVIGEDGRLISIKAGDKTYKTALNPNGGTVNTPTGDITLKGSPQGTSFTLPTGANGSINFSKDGKSGTMVINGTTIPIIAVNRDGKDYLSFPWYGHKVLVENGCTFTANNDGELIIDAPSKAK